VLSSVTHLSCPPSVFICTLCIIPNGIDIIKLLCQVCVVHFTGARSVLCISRMPGLCCAFQARLQAASGGGDGQEGCDSKLCSVQGYAGSWSLLYSKSDPDMASGGAPRCPLCVTERNPLGLLTGDALLLECIVNHLGM